MHSERKLDKGIIVSRNSLSLILPLILYGFRLLAICTYFYYYWFVPGYFFFFFSNFFCARLVLALNDEAYIKKLTFNIYKFKSRRERRRWKEEHKSHKKREKLHSQKFFHAIDRSTYTKMQQLMNVNMTAQCSTDSLSLTHSLIW